MWLWLRMFRCTSVRSGWVRQAARSRPLIHVGPRWHEVFLSRERERVSGRHTKKTEGPAVRDVPLWYLHTLHTVRGTNYVWDV